MHFLAADVFADLPKVRNFKARTLSGDVADIPGLQEQAPILPFVTSTNDNCLGRECPDYETCFLVKARRKALDAQVVVINHHLFLPICRSKIRVLVNCRLMLTSISSTKRINYPILPASILANHFPVANFLMLLKVTLSLSFGSQGYGATGQSSGSFDPGLSGNAVIVWCRAFPWQSA